ncbi:MAG: hypothetical protein V1838_04935 [Patescibacteria group bacterium]
MFGTTHASVGIVISQHVDKPLNIFLLAILSHFILDFIPHGDERLYHDEEWKENKKYKRVTIITAIDLTLLITMTLILYSTNDLPRMALISAGIIGSTLPDLLNQVLPVFHEKLNWLFVVRWLHKFLKSFRLGTFLKAHNSLHGWLHRAAHFRVPAKVGLTLQAVITFVGLYLAFGFK